MNRIGWTEKWTLRYAVVALVWLAINGFEGVLMRLQLLAPHSPVLPVVEAPINLVRPVAHTPSTVEVFYSMMTAHPICGIYGFAYMAVMGAFYYLVPYLLKKDIRHRRLVPLNFWLQNISVFAAWGAGFFLLFNSLYTLYWPLPVSYDRVPLAGSVVFALLPMLTGLDIRSKCLADIHFWAWLIGAMVMNYASGLAGARGMLRRTLYDPPVFEPHMAWALAGSLLMTVGFAAFLANLLITLGRDNLLSLVVPDRWRKRLPAAA